MRKILVIGSLNMDFVINVDHMPLKGETILSGDFDLIPGGKGANQAYATGKLGGSVAMLGAVGDDDYGRALVKNLESVGVDMSHIKTCGHTGNAFITVDKNGDNSIIVVQGANAAVDKAYIDENIQLIKDSDIIVLQLEIPLETVCHAAKTAKGLGKTVILDPAPAKSGLPEELIHFVDIVKPNEVELQMLLDDPEADKHLRQSAEMLVSMGAATVAVTLGGEGAYLYRNGEEKRFACEKGLKAVDTTAAGDSFTGALALGLAEGRSIEESIEFAIKVAGIVVTRKGAQTSIPSRDEIEE